MRADLLCDKVSESQVNYFGVVYVCESFRLSGEFLSFIIVIYHLIGKNIQYLAVWSCYKAFS